MKYDNLSGNVYIFPILWTIKSRIKSYIFFKWYIYSDNAFDFVLPREADLRNVHVLTSFLINNMTFKNLSGQNTDNVRIHWFLFLDNFHRYYCHFKIWSAHNVCLCYKYIFKGSSSGSSQWPFFTLLITWVLLWMEKQKEKRKKYIYISDGFFSCKLDENEILKKKRHTHTQKPRLVLIAFFINKKIRIF